MRDLTIITKTSLDVEKCLEQIKTIYGGAKGNKNQINVGKPPKSLYILFPSIKKYDKSEHWDEDELKNLPDEYDYFTNIEFHLTSVSKKVVKALQSAYPDMIIEDEDGKFYSIDEYITAEFDY